MTTRGGTRFRANALHVRPCIARRTASFASKPITLRRALLQDAKRSLLASQRPSVRGHAGVTEITHM